MGRAMKKFGPAGSKFANPFPLERGGNRDEVIEKYRVWLWEDRKVKLLCKIFLTWTEKTWYASVHQRDATAMLS